MHQIKIKNFKCFQDIKIPVNKLTIFAGANGNGKSTVIQSLLFLRRTIEHCGTWNPYSLMYQYEETNGLNVELNGSYCLSLGGSDNIQNQIAPDASTSIAVCSANGEVKVEYSFPEKDDLWLKPSTVENTLKKDIPNPITRQQFYYLNAERLGPRIKQEIKFYDYPTTGYQGEFVAQLLGDTEFSYKFRIDENKLLEKEKNNRLEYQVNEWLGFIMPGVSIKSTYDSATMSAQIRVNNPYSKINSILTTNIGFGISYVLPIIVSCLIAEKDSYLVVENPEAHLHPSAQSKIGRFLAKMSQAGIHIIVETHSDHIINGIQVAVVKKEILPEEVTINFFSQESEQQPHLESISINEKGELSSWPKGFFDQSQRDYAELFKFRKG